MSDGMSTACQTSDETPLPRLSNKLDNIPQNDDLGMNDVLCDVMQVDNTTGKTVGKLVERPTFLKNASSSFIKNNKFLSPTRPYSLEFESKPPHINVANECPLSNKFQKSLVAGLIRDKVLIPCDKTELQCTANSFFVGEGASTRLITDFKCLNPYMKQKLPVHKCDCRSIAVKLSEPGFRANLDMRRAFFSIPIAQQECS
eukprot:GHVR01060791.1.p1 GENE.GHVR01060791.1~~GHVR01060791.1.p1  ORF type:complete len:201 (-),score=15.51 GHVR01060791.1:780-1382(-)